MKLAYAVVVLSVSLLVPLGDTFAQRPNNQRPNNRRGRGNMRGPMGNQNIGEQMQRQGPMRMNEGQVGGGNGMGGGGRPDPAQLAQRLMANFDADGSGSLDQAELQAALAGMQQRRMQQRGNGQDQMQDGARQAGRMQRGNNQMQRQRIQGRRGGPQPGQARR